VKFLERLDAEPIDPVVIAAHLCASRGGTQSFAQPCACCGALRVGLAHLDPATGTYDCEER